MKILFNNKFIKKSEAKISIFSEAFMYGYGVFETLRTYQDKKIFKVDEHLNRLFQSAKIIGFKIKYSKADLLKMLEKLTQKSNYKLQKIKIIAVKEAVILYSEKLEEFPEFYSNGVSCMTTVQTRSIPEAKTLSFINSYICNQKAKSQNFYEAILLDKNKEVYEGSYSNIFWFENKTLCTRSGEVLAGITRETVIQISPYKVKFKKIKLDSLLKKSEIFLTQTTKGIVPITKIDNKIIGNGNVGTKTNELIEIFNKYTVKE